MAEGAHRRTPMAKKPRFSTLILPGMVRDWRLAVPKLFAEEYGDRLSNRVVFKLPDGAEWPIRLSGSGDKIWFSKGWRQFADFYSVNSMGYFLVFEYIGNSRFLVAVFHPNASEISYPPSHVANSNGADDGGESGDEEDGESVEISGSYPSSPETRQVSLVMNNCSRPSKLKRGLDRGSSSETTPDDELSSDSSQEEEGCPVNRMFGRPEPVSAAKKASALTRARAAFRSDKPFFMLAMQPSSVYAPMCCNLPLPVYFSERYLNDNFRETVLQLPGGRRAWIVESSVTSTAGKKRVFFHHQSWLAFAKDTNLKVGDVCAFELMDGGAKPTFEVTIFRAAQGSGSSPGGNGGVCRRTLSAALPGRGVLKRNMQSSKGEDNCYRQSTVFGSSSKAATPYTSVNPSFEVNVALSHVDRNHRNRPWKVRIPYRFASSIEKDVCEAELWVEGSYWLVKLDGVFQKGKEYLDLAGGWRKFAEENSVQIGDMCLFELVGTKKDGNRKTMKFNVNISRGKYKIG